LAGLFTEGKPSFSQKIRRIPNCSIRKSLHGTRRKKDAKLLGFTTTGGFEKKYTVTNDANETIEITAEDVLIHVFEEEVHHRGELIVLLWQMGVEPPLMGWKNL